MNKIKFFAVVFICWAASVGHAQIAPSPMNSLGIGKIMPMDLIQNSTMGGLGVGSGSYWNLNNLNPAMLIYNKRTIFNELTVFQAGMVLENLNISDPNITETSGSGGMNYLVTGFPVMKNKWYTSIGLQPYSSAVYNFSYSEAVEGNPDATAFVNEIGEGGLTQIYWNNGVAITKNISAGLSSSVIFGSRKKEYNYYFDVSNTSNTPEGGYASALYQRKSVRGIALKGGLVYMDSIQRNDKAPLKVTVGLTYDFESSINGKDFESMQRRNFSGTVFSNDTIKDNISGKLNLPMGFAMGASISKGFNWSVGADFGMKKYSQLEDFDNTFQYRDMRYAAAGAEYTPNPFSVNSYFSRISYRMGLRYEETAYLINGVGVNDFGINFGVSLPIVPSAGNTSVLSKGFSSVDMGFSYGVQGSLNDNLMKEEYFKFRFGVTFNERWFVRRKFN